MGRSAGYINARKKAAKRLNRIVEYQALSLPNLIISIFSKEVEYSATMVLSIVTGNPNNAHTKSISGFPVTNHAPGITSIS